MLLFCSDFLLRLRTLRCSHAWIGRSHERCCPLSATASHRFITLRNFLASKTNRFKSHSPISIRPFSPFFSAVARSFVKWRRALSRSLGTRQRELQVEQMLRHVCNHPRSHPAPRFSSAHFTIFSDGSRERLHGHNFSVSVDVEVISRQARRSGSPTLPLQSTAVQCNRKTVLSAACRALLTPMASLKRCRIK